MKKIRNLLILFAFAATALCGLFFISTSKQSEVLADTPDNYYSSVTDSMSGETLRSQLHSIINNSSVDQNYDWSRFEAADEDPDNPKNIITIYARTSLSKSDHVSGSKGWNREHSFPQSKMSGGDGAKSDNHVIFASDNKVNGKRSNYKLADHTGTKPNVYDYKGNLTPCIFANNTFDPGDTVARGMVARSTFYCAAMYNYDVEDNIESIETALKWHLTYKVGDGDKRRNDVVYSNQHNRNPFVDHPSYACRIWGTSGSAKAICDQYNGWTEEDLSKTLTKIEVTQQPSKKTYNEGESFDKTGLVVTATYSTGNTENVTSEVTVSPDPLTVGTTSVTLSYKYGSDTKTAVVSGITVNPVTPVTSVTINNSKRDFYINETCTLDTTVLPINATNKSLTYTTSKSSVATVDTSGKVSFKAAGSTTITAKSHNNISASITFNVTKKLVPVTSIEASLPSSSYYVGNTADIQYTVKPTNADNKAVSFSSSDSSVATVSSSGHVSFLKAGEVTFTVKSAEDPSIIATINVTVSEKPVDKIPVDSVIFDSVKTKVEVGDTVQLFANISPKDATDKTLTYSSGNDSVAEVSASGLVTFKAAGSVTITAKSHNNKTASRIFKVSAVPTPESKLIEIAITNKPSKLVYSVGETFSESGLEVKAHYLDGSSEEITGKVFVSTPDTSTAGTKKVTVSYRDAFTTEFEIIVVEETVSKLRITKYPLKTNYFETEEFNPLGLKASAIFGNDVRDVSELVTFQYNFSESNKVYVCFKDLSVNIEVTIETGEISNEHEAADFAYIVENKIPDTDACAEVTINDWNSFEYNYNTLDEGAKQVLKDIVTDYSGGAASAEDKLTEKLIDCVKKYDVTYLKHKDEGFNDFMGRNPQDNTSDKKGTDKKLILALVGIGVGVIVLVTIIIVVAVVVSRKGKKKNA